MMSNHGFHPRLFTFNPYRGCFFLSHSQFTTGFTRSYSHKTPIGVVFFEPFTIHNSTPIEVVFFEPFTIHNSQFTIKPLSGLFFFEPFTIHHGFHPRLFTFNPYRGCFFLSHSQFTIHNSQLNPYRGCFF